MCGLPERPLENLELIIDVFLAGIASMLLVVVGLPQRLHDLAFQGRLLVGRANVLAL